MLLTAASLADLVCLQFFVRLDHIHKCFTQKGGIFVLEEYSELAGNAWQVQSYLVVAGYCD